MESQPLRLLLAGARKGDAHAYQQLLSEFGPRLYGYFYRSTASHHDAEDLLSEVMLRLVRNLGEYDERGRFEPWLFRIAANLLRDRIRRTKTSPTAFSLDSPSAQGLSVAETVSDGREGPDAPLEFQDLSETLQRAIGRLDETSRQMLLLRHFAQMSFKEIAEVFDCPIGTVLARVHRAIKSLRQILEDDDEFH